VKRDCIIAFGALALLLVAGGIIDRANAPAWWSGLLFLGALILIGRNL